jgi:hypothetical protein
MPMNSNAKQYAANSMLARVSEEMDKVPATNIDQFDILHSVICQLERDRSAALRAAIENDGYVVSEHD